MERIKTATCNLCNKNIDGETLQDRTDELKRLEPELVISSDIHVCHICLHNRKVEKKMEELKPIAEAISRSINSSVFNYDGVELEAIVNLFNREHRHLQHTLVTFIWQVFRALGKQAGDPKWCDDRNACAMNWMGNCEKADELAQFAERISRLEQCEGTSTVEYQMNSLIDEAKRILK